MRFDLSGDEIVGVRKFVGSASRSRCSPGRGNGSTHDFDLQWLVSTTPAHKGCEPPFLRHLLGLIQSRLDKAMLVPIVPGLPNVVASHVLTNRYGSASPRPANARALASWKNVAKE